MHEIAHKNVYLVTFFLGSSNASCTAEAAEPIFIYNTSNDVVPCKDLPFWGLKTKI